MQPYILIHHVMVGSRAPFINRDQNKSQYFLLLIKLIVCFSQGGHLRMCGQTLCGPNLQRSRVHPPAWPGAPRYQTRERSPAGQPLPAGQAGRFRPHAETRNLHPLHIGHAAVYGPRAVRHGPGGRPDGGEGSSAQRAA